MNKIKLLFAFLFFGLQFTFAQSNEVQILTPKQFHEIATLNPNAYIIDVRKIKDFKKGHIEEAFCAEKSERLYQLVDSLGKFKEYLLYCKYGDRSVVAGRMLYKKYGLKVYSLEKGLDYWKEFKLPIKK